MPQLIRTPEQIFREEGKDIYFIRFHEENWLAKKELQDWLQENIPDAPTEDLAPSEKSGYIVGYFGDLRVDFSASDLALFCARWENADGDSLDPRFQCYLFRYKTWYEKYGRFIPTLDRPAGPGLSVWWDTLIGFVYHQLSQEEATKPDLDEHPGVPEDIWMHAVRLWPELAALDTSRLTGGEISKTPDNHWRVIYLDEILNEENHFSPQRQKDLLEWFNLPGDTEVARYDY